MMSSDMIIIKCSLDEQIVTEKSDLIDKIPSMAAQIKFDSNLLASVIEVNASSHDMRQIISYIRNKEFQFTSVRNGMNIYQISKTYEINDLKEKCQKYLKDNINPNNVCQIHDFACQQEDYVIQYHCWALFDSSSAEIFLGENFLECSETTIFRILSRPIYQSLTELNIFLAIYSWCKRKNYKRNQEEKDSNIINMHRTEYEGIRQIMVQFLPLIRFLVITPESLEGRVLYLHILKPEEIQGIRQYHRNKDMNRLPDTICKNTRKRTKDCHLFLYRFYNVHNLNFLKDKLLKSNYEFFCEILVTADCFVTHIQLPIKDYNKKASLKLIFGGRNLTSLDNFRNAIVTCNPEGKIKLEEPLFLKANMQYELKLHILDDQTKSIKSFKIISDALCYMFESVDESTSTKTIEEKMKMWRHFYFDVTLYF